MKLLLNKSLNQRRFTGILSKNWCLGLTIAEPRKTPEEEFRYEHGRAPGQFFHACPEWDYLLIDKECVEFEACLCYSEENKDG